MSQITVYGASDDLVEVEGDIDEEFSPGDDDRYLMCSDGTVLRIEYRDGVWRITPVVRGVAELVIEQAPEDDEDNYSDRATLTADKEFAWVALGEFFAKRKR